jgi:hypothetical protein
MYSFVHGASAAFGRASLDADLTKNAPALLCQRLSAAGDLTKKRSGDSRKAAIIRV